MLHQAVSPRVLKVTKDIVAVDKPPGLSFHQQHPDAPGVLQVLRKQQADGLLQLPDTLFPVHRLDSVTSGVLLFATSSAAAGELIGAFREGRVQKYYVALSHRRPSKKQGSVVGDMERSRRSSWKLLRSTADPAVTRFTSCSLGSLRSGLRLYVLKPETGRTHQLRVAMKSLGAPILGDPLYSAAAEAQQEDRAYLHAAAIRVQLPGGRRFQVTCRPSIGRWFSEPAVLAAYDSYLPVRLDDDYGTWFQNERLLTSWFSETDPFDTDVD